MSVSIGGGRRGDALRDPVATVHCGQIGRQYLGLDGMAILQSHLGGLQARPRPAQPARCRCRPRPVGGRNFGPQPPPWAPVTRGGAHTPPARFSATLSRRRHWGRGRGSRIGCAGLGGRIRRGPTRADGSDGNESTPGPHLRLPRVAVSARAVDVLGVGVRRAGATGLAAGLGGSRLGRDPAGPVDEAAGYPGGAPLRRRLRRRPRRRRRRPVACAARTGPAEGPSRRHRLARSPTRTPRMAAKYRDDSGTTSRMITAMPVRPTNADTPRIRSGAVTAEVEQTGTVPARRWTSTRISAPPGPAPAAAEGSRRAAPGAGRKDDDLESARRSARCARSWLDVVQGPWGCPGLKSVFLFLSDALSLLFDLTSCRRR